MDLSFVKNISKESADIHLFGEIGEDFKAKDFINELNYIIEGLGIKQVNVRINSPGGSVIDGFGIFSAILNAKATVDTYNDGMAASAAGFIMMAGNTRYTIENGVLMLHGVSWRKEAADAEEQRKIDNAISAMEKSIISILSNNSGLSEEEVRAMMNRETWITASEAVEMKLVDKILPNTPAKRMAKNELMEFVNSISNKNENTMKNLLNSLGLNTEASEQSAIDAVTALKNKVTELENSNNALTSENATLKTENETLKSEKEESEKNNAETAAEEAVNKAIEAGKFDKSKKESLLNLAKNNLEAFNSMADAVNVTVKPANASIAAQMQTGAGAENKTNAAGDDRSTWTMRDWEKKDPKGLENMEKNDPEGFKNLYNQTYKS